MKINVKSMSRLIDECAINNCTLKKSYKNENGYITISFGYYYKGNYFYSVKRYKSNTHKGLYARYIAQAYRLECKIAD